MSFRRKLSLAVIFAPIILILVALTILGFVLPLLSLIPWDPIVFYALVGALITTLTAAAIAVLKTHSSSGEQSEIRKSTPPNTRQISQTREFESYSPRKRLIIKTLVGRSLTISDISAKCNLSHPAANMLLADLMKRGLVTRMLKGGKFWFTLSRYGEVTAEKLEASIE